MQADACAASIMRTVSHRLSCQPDKIVAVLLVSDEEADHISLRRILDNSNWQLHGVRSCREARAFLEEHYAPVVICGCDLPDGGWKGMLDEVTTMPKPPSLIVSSRLADERLWAEVLNLGGYDLLLTPFEENEVFWVTYFAWRSSRTG